MDKITGRCVYGNFGSLPVSIAPYIVYSQIADWSIWAQIPDCLPSVEISTFSIPDYFPTAIVFRGNKIFAKRGRVRCR